ncbi:hypothetical protein [Streptomyces huasconensis]|uniref:hypothetical protein n=1 Tax=Streptomyces huasconensis TaxID=1854574 RepID=UPI003700C6D6
MQHTEIEEIAARIGSTARGFASGYEPSAVQKADAASVLRDMVQAASRHGLTLADFDAVADFPRLAIQLVQQRDAQI